MYLRLTCFAAVLLTAVTLTFGQSNATSAGWHKVGDPGYGPVPGPPSPAQSPDGQAPMNPVPPDQVPANQVPANQVPANQAPANQAPPAQAPANQGPGYQQRPYSQPPYSQSTYPQSTYQQPGPYGNQAPAPATQPVPASLRMPAGTFITVRMQQALSSDRNHPGDAFSATLAQPLVVNGVVIAEPGQTLSGQVVEAEKAGRIEGTARLRVHLTELTLVDGQQVPIQTQFVGRRGPTSVSRDAGAVAGTTGLGAAIGAAAGRGAGAAIGAGSGAAVGLLGVLLTRGHASVIYPEETLTFRLESPISVDTQRSAQAFRYVQPNEYNQPLMTQPPPAPPAPPTPPPVVVAPAPVYYPYYASYPYPYFYGPSFYGPSFSLFYGHGYYGGPGYRRPYYGWRR